MLDCFWMMLYLKVSFNHSWLFSSWNQARAISEEKATFSLAPLHNLVTLVTFPYLVSLSLLGSKDRTSGTSA